MKRRSCLLLLVLITTPRVPAAPPDRHDWQSLQRLQSGERVRLTLKTRTADGAFQSWTPEQVTAGSVTARKEDVVRIERYRRGHKRGRNAAIGASIGFAGGFAIGAAAGGCKQQQLGPCISRGALGAVIGAAGAVAGAVVGLLVPQGSFEVVYEI